jgi:hypothetical protein
MVETVAVAMADDVPSHAGNPHQLMARISLRKNRFYGDVRCLNGIWRLHF